MRFLVPILLAVANLTSSGIAHAEWQPKRAPLMTRWAQEVTPENVHAEYPRPQLVREHWLNLNGLWDYAITDKAAEQPADWDGEILVPFPVESALSGVMRSVGPEQVVWYRRAVTIPQETAWSGKNVLLHFGAVDWETTVWVNGQEVGRHRGGYDPFSLDITAALQSRPGATAELVVRVFDPSDAGFQPRGKQVRNPHGIWYTPTTGIWQTVWLEPVPKTYLRNVTITPDLDKSQLSITADVVNPQPGWKLGIYFKSQPEKRPNQEPVGGIFSRSWQLDLRTPYVASIDTRGIPIERHWWTPEQPHLIDVYVALVADQNADLMGFAQEWMPKLTGAGAPEAAPAVHLADVVKCYTAFRKISLGKDEQGVTRILLNNQPLFQYGTLDQGFWPDGLYTAPTDEALKFDIEITKQYGFNMIRKHVKVEPARWYYHCDKLGMLVWQDMPSGDRHAEWDPAGKFNGKEIVRSEKSAANFRHEWQNIMTALRPHPSIVMWVPFNEAWGQSDTVAVTRWTKEFDPTRLVNCASGGNDFPVGDVIDVHRYPGPFAPPPEEHRASVLGEYGGLGLPLKGHTWQGEKNWGYRSFTSAADLTEAYLDLIDKLHPLIREPGLSAAIYTQTTDVEIEVNGLLTYDRQIQKIPVKVASRAHQQLWEPAPEMKVLVPSAQVAAAEYRFMLTQPGTGWERPDFDDQAWSRGQGGFGEPSTPGSIVNTPWTSADVWLRREFQLDQLPTGELRLWMHHDEDAAVYLNGVLLKKVTGYTTDYQSFRVTAAGAAALKVGSNLLAIHCHQTGGGQYIDVGLNQRVPAQP